MFIHQPIFSASYLERGKETFTKSKQTPWKFAIDGSCSETALVYHVFSLLLFNDSHHETLSPFLTSAAEVSSRERECLDAWGKVREKDNYKKNPQKTKNKKTKPKPSRESSFPTSALKETKLPLPRLAHTVQYMGRWTDLFTRDYRTNLSIRCAGRRTWNKFFEISWIHRQ